MSPLEGFRMPEASALWRKRGHRRAPLRCEERSGVSLRFYFCGPYASTSERKAKVLPKSSCGGWLAMKLTLT